MKKPPPIVSVTDHALLRWLERAQGVDIEFFRACVASEAQPLVDAGACGGHVGDQWFVLDGNKLITVLPEKPPQARRGESLQNRESRRWPAQK